MPDEIDRNQIDSQQRGRSMRMGDVPDRMLRRYYLQEKGGPGLGFYVDARVPVPAFRDLGSRLVSGRIDPNAIRDMAKVAQHRGWTVVTVHGEREFRREAWLATMASGIEARGYRPTERDRQELERRVAHSVQRAERALPKSTQTTRDEAAPYKVVEAVVRNRVQDPVVQERILHTARQRLAKWLERGALMQSLKLGPAEERRRDGRERQRGR